MAQEPCLHTPDIFHGRTVAEIRADADARPRYRRLRWVHAVFPPEYKGVAEGSEDRLQLRRIAFEDHPLSERYDLDDLGEVLEVWEILARASPEFSHGVVLRTPPNLRVYGNRWVALDGHCHVSYGRIGWAVWDLACNGGVSYPSSTGWIRPPREP
ncbi:hypothetical protein LPC10_08360 [Methylorubrum sp. B1-46]|uniref:hypothetical protein n=1 Tax=Methylorubrum sp. B1-46 TaxID=2897334 RepID=UPI001E381584|nr:hypothetical protein [Methylorubrum sp. B1-46]UGB27561.1 hypothetical protein LPC10_08360 [Methylorubrum sp. B1-46]